MPLPENYDNKEDFLKACIPIVIKEGKDNNQAVAICNSMWEKKEMQRGEGQGQGNSKENDGGTDFCYCPKCDYKVKHDRGTPCNEMKCPECGAVMTGVKPGKKEMKLETKNINDVEIFETGLWKGVPYTEKDLDEMIKNFDNKVAEPYITIDHSDKASGQFKDALQALALGFVEKLERKGKKLIAGFKQVPKTIADLIEAGPLKKKSIEFYRNHIANGKLYKNVLQGVTFHGANGLPEVNTLSDFINLYKSNLQVMEKSKKNIVSISNEDKEEKSKMGDKIELKQDEYNELLKKSSQIDVIQEQNKTLNESMTKLKSDSEKVLKASEELKLKQEKIEKQEKEILKSEADEYISKKINDGFIKPAHKNRYVAEYVMYKAHKETFDNFKDDIESRGKVINLDPTKKNENQVTTNFKYDPEKLDFKVGSTINYDELEANIQAIMKVKNCSWEDAAIECNAIHPDDIGKEEVAK